MKFSPDPLVISVNCDVGGGGGGGGWTVVPPPPPPQEAMDTSNSDRTGNRPKGRKRIFVNIIYSIKCTRVHCRIFSLVAKSFCRCVYATSVRLTLLPPLMWHIYNNSSPSDAAFLRNLLRVQLAVFGAIKYFGSDSWRLIPRKMNNLGLTRDWEWLQEMLAFLLLSCNTVPMNGIFATIYTLRGSY